MSARIVRGFLLCATVVTVLMVSSPASAFPCDHHCGCDQRLDKPPNSYTCSWSCTCSGGVVITQECEFCPIF